MSYYAVKKGIEPGVYTTWEECNKQIDGFSGSEYKKFKTEDEATDYLNTKQSLRINHWIYLSLLMLEISHWITLSQRLTQWMTYHPSKGTHLTDTNRVTMFSLPAPAELENRI